MEKPNVLALLRISTKEQSEGDRTGLERQQADIEFNVARFNLKVVETFVLSGICGAIVEANPDFKRMLRTLKRPDISGVVLSTLDRWMRPEHLDSYSIFKVFRDKSKLFYSFDSDHGLNPTNSDDRTIIVTAIEAAHRERLKIAYWTSRGKERLMQDAQISITKLPKGVRHIKDGTKTKNGHFEYTDYAYQNIKPAFERVANGEAISKVANELGFANETSLRYVLDNKWWIGIRERTKKRTMTYNEQTGDRIFSKRIPHNNPLVQETNLAAAPLISTELFNQVQQVITSNRNRWTQANSNANQFLGTKFLVCGKCGRKMYLHYWKRKGQPATYTCSGKCGAKRLRAIPTDATIWNAALMYFADVNYLVQAIVKAKDCHESKTRHETVRSFQDMLEDLDNRKKRILRALETDESDDDALARYNKIKQEISETKIRLATAKAQAQPFGTDDAATISQAIVNRFVGCESWTVEQKREALAEVVEKIEVTDDTATFTVRGGLPVQRQLTAGEFPASKVSPAKRIFVETAVEEHAKLNVLS